MIKAKELPKMNEEEIQHFWSMVDIQYGCWNWKHSKNLQGYGHVKIRGEKHAAHRIAWFVSNKKQPGNFLVCHTCDNPSCCNPAHLFLGTHSENTYDCVSKGRWRNKDGFDQDDVSEIKKMKLQGYNQTQIANKFHINQSTVSRILSGKRWSHVK